MPQQKYRCLQKPAANDMRSKVVFEADITKPFFAPLPKKSKAAAAIAVILFYNTRKTGLICAAADANSRVLAARPHISAI